MLLEGIFLPLTTPFYPDGRIYLRKLESNVRRYSLTPAAGMLVLGEVGEAEALTDEETKAIFAAAIRPAAKEKVMIASIGRESVYATLKLSDEAAACGYDAVAVRGPGFTEDACLNIEMMTYFRAVADGSPLPVILVSSPGRRLHVDTLAELADHPQVIGAIDSGSSAPRVAELKARTSGVSREDTVTATFLAATRRMLAASLATGGTSLGGVAVLEARPDLKTRTKRVGFQILSGDTAGMLASWGAGASGGVPRLGAAAPQASCEIWQAFKDGDPPLAEEKQERVRQVAARMEGARGIGAIKYACDFNAYFGGRPRLPLLGLTASEAGEIERALAGMRN